MSCAPALPSDLTLNIGAGGSVGGYYTLQDSMTVSTITVTAGNTLELLGLNVVRSSFTVGGTLVIRGTETINTVPLLQTGSIVTYNAPSANPVVMSTWTYRN